MTMLATLGPEEWKATTPEERRAWLDLATTKRLVGWLTERVAAATERARGHRERAATALDSSLLSFSDVLRDYTTAKAYADAMRDVLAAIEAVGEVGAPHATSEAA